MPVGDPAKGLAFLGVTVDDIEALVAEARQPRGTPVVTEKWDGETVDAVSEEPVDPWESDDNGLTEDLNEENAGPDPWDTPAAEDSKPQTTAPAAPAAQQRGKEEGPSSRCRTRRRSRPRA